jgi:hypothetical protein
MYGSYRRKKKKPVIAALMTGVPLQAFILPSAGIIQIRFLG